jgi:SAM-dependent methyltransferase
LALPGSLLKRAPGGASMTQKEHWEQVYSTRLAEKLGWYKPRLDTSIRWIRELDLDKGAPVIDVGGGASTLADDLLDEGFESIAVLDISESALAITKKRLGRQADLVMWLSGDITTYALPQNRFELWHDRAVLHFLTGTEEQQAYCTNLLNTLRPGGYLIIAVFAHEAPPKCSGLAVRRYDHEELSSMLGDQFELVRHHKEKHITPRDIEQMYVYCLFRRIAD